jgi:hypothetical protein
MTTQATGTASAAPKEGILSRSTTVAGLIGAAVAIVGPCLGWFIRLEIDRAEVHGTDTRIEKRVENVETRQDGDHSSVVEIKNDVKWIKQYLERRAEK